MINFQFSQKWYSEKDLLKVCPVSRSYLYKLHHELLEQGKDASEMGKIRFDGSKQTLWCPIKFVEYLEKYRRTTQPIKYDYEKAESENVHVAIQTFKKQHIGVQ